MRKRTRSALQRVLERVEIAENGCWLWPGATGAGGYGLIREEGHGPTLSTHRVTYEALVGPIPDGYQVDHFRCDNPPCCNPDHLVAVPPRQNVLRGDTVAARNLMKTHCPQGHAYDDENTFYDTGDSRRCRACRRLYMAAYMRRYRSERAQ